MERVIIIRDIANGLIERMMIEGVTLKTGRFSETELLRFVEQSVPETAPAI